MKSQHKAVVQVNTSAMAAVGGKADIISTVFTVIYGHFALQEQENSKTLPVK
ncbi:protein of unknown function [uncultured Woeseiaceae bacterium]|uniref:Uncharacterized protein n=1 Tax=uncultured Woeseiaceae bacterium TaxID=1983305 RepID=A0A7D9D1Z4_9GAMM|nr:protein of unknown function [uncultured Woeseiaceae bacterium]